MKKKISWWVIVTGAIVGLAAVLLTHFGNPANMGFCIACFLRDIAGSLGLHSAGKVQYIRPEIIGLVLGAFVMSVCTKEFRAKSGSAPALRFVLGAFVMIGALAFLGCPLRMVLRLGGGDLNALNEKVKAQGGEVIGINTETLDGNQQGIDAAKKLLETTGASYRNIYFASGSEAGKFALNIMAFPTTYVFDRDGNVVGQPLLGGIDKEENLAALQKNIDAALAKDSAK
jgi:hypothetical protein